MKITYIDIIGVKRNRLSEFNALRSLWDIVEIVDPEATPAILFDCHLQGRFCYVFEGPVLRMDPEWGLYPTWRLDPDEKDQAREMLLERLGKINEEDED